MFRNDNCIKKAYWWILIIIFLFSAISLELASLFSDSWFFQSTKSYEWHGGILHPNSNFSKHKASQSYLDIWKDCNQNIENNTLSSNDCSLFKSLYIGGIIYVTLESLSIMFGLMTLIFLITDMFCNLKRPWISIPLFWNMFATHLIGFWIWSGYSSLFYSSDCEDIDWNANNISSSVCAEKGAIISFMCILWIPLIGSIHLIAYFSLKLKLKPKTKSTAALEYPKVESDFSQESQNNEENCLHTSPYIDKNLVKDNSEPDALFPIQEERPSMIAETG